MDCKSPSGIHFHIFEIDSTWPITAVSATKFKRLYCFFGCHGNNEVYLFWLLLRNSIIPETLKRLRSWFSELERKRTSTWFEYCSYDVILASFPFKKWLSWRLPCGTLQWNISRTRRGIYKRSSTFVLFSSALSFQTNFLFGWTFPLTKLFSVLNVVFVMFLEGWPSGYKLWLLAEKLLSWNHQERCLGRHVASLRFYIISQKNIIFLFGVFRVGTCLDYPITCVWQNELPGSGIKLS